MAAGGGSILDIIAMPSEMTPSGMIAGGQTLHVVAISPISTIPLALVAWLD
jgi:hypothetical protein